MRSPVTVLSLLSLCITVKTAGQAERLPSLAETPKLVRLVASQTDQLAGYALIYRDAVDLEATAKSQRLG